VSPNRLNSMCGSSKNVMLGEEDFFFDVAGFGIEGTTLFTKESLLQQ